MSDITKVKDIPVTVTTAIEALRKFAKYLVIPTGVTTFFSDEWLQHMRLLSIKNSSVGTWVSVVFWISISIVIIDWLHIGSKKFKSMYNKWKYRKEFAKNMDTLTDTEKDIVYKIFRNDTYNFDGIRDAAVKKLNSQGIISSGEYGDPVSGFSYVLQPIARDFLIKKTEYFDEYIKEMKQHIISKIDELKASISNISEFDYKYHDVQDEIQYLQNILKQYE